MNERPKRPPQQTMQRALGLREATENDALAQTLASVFPGRRLTEAQIALFGRLFATGTSAAEFGPRPARSGVESGRRLTWRIPERLHERLDRFFELFPSIEKNRLVDVAIGELLNELGF